MTLTLNRYPMGFAGMGDDSSPDDLAAQLNALDPFMLGAAGPNAAGSVSAMEQSGNIQTYYDVAGNLIVPGGTGGNLIDGYTSISPSGAITNVSNANLPSAAMQSSTGIPYTGSVYGNAGATAAGTSAQQQAIASLIAIATGQTGVPATKAPATSTGMSSGTVLAIAGIAIFGILLVAANR